MALAAAALGCSKDQAAPEQAIIREQYAPRIIELIERDLRVHREAVEEAATRLAPGFAIDDADKREREMRAALRIVQSPKKGIEAFVASPMTFLAAIDASGVVIARDRTSDTMKGKDFKARFAAVREALEGRTGYALGEFSAGDGNQPPSVSMLFSAPATRDGQPVGAVLAGIPLYRMAQRLQRQLRVEHAADVARGVAIWVYVYKGDRLFHWDTSPRVDAEVPAAPERARGLAANRTGYTGAIFVAGEPYAYGVFPTPTIASDVGVVVVRAGP